MIQSAARIHQIQAVTRIQVQANLIQVQAEPSTTSMATVQAA
jgi:hypothetical protein